MNKKYLILIIILAVAAILSGLFYYLYITYPNNPKISLQEEGYKVTAVMEFPKQEILVEIFRDATLISSVQSAGSHFLEYLPPGDYTYEFQYTTENLLGMEKTIRQSKQLNIKELSNSELRQYFDFPSVNLATVKYGIYISYPELKRFSKIDIFRNNQNIKTLSLESAEDKFLEHVSPNNYTYKIIFSSEEFKSLEGFLQQSYEIEVKPISPTIVSVKPTPLYKGYSSNITATVENAAYCKADLLLYPPSDFERTGPTILKSYEFSIGDKLDYFYRHSESWSWDEILFPEPKDVNTADYDMDLRLACYDYYKSTHTEKTEKFPTSEDVSQTSISIGYYRDQSGTVYGEVASLTWTDLSCRLMIGDQSNYTLDEKSFLLQGRHNYEFNISSYNRNFLYVTAICKDSDGQSITKISTFQAE